MDELAAVQRELEQRQGCDSNAAIQFEDDRYQFLEEIARGGAAVVCRVRDNHLQREIAIKFLLDSHDNRDMRCRLEREARLCARLVHPGIVPIHELTCFADQRPFVIMKLIRGKTLLQLLESTPPPSSKSLLEIFAKVCEAMAFAHEQGIIHRDLKPSNIMVGSFGEVQIMDWGLAKELERAERNGLSAQNKNPNSHSDGACSVEPWATSASATATVTNHPAETTLLGTVCGTLAYMAPEQAQGKIDLVDQRSDVFALGGVLCRLLTGAPPYQEAHFQNLLECAQAGQLHDAWQRLAKSPHRQWAKLATQCLMIEREHRPANASVLANRVADLRSARQNARYWWGLACAALMCGGLAVWLVVMSNQQPKMNNSPQEPSAPKTMVFLEPGAYKALLTSNQKDNVLNSYRTILDHYSADAQLRELTAIALINSGRASEAGQVVQEAIELDPTNPDYYFLLCDILKWQGDFQAAHAALRRSTECRDRGRLTRLPLEAKELEMQTYMAIQRSLDQDTPHAWQGLTQKELETWGRVCEFTSRLELAEVYYQRALAKAANPTDASLLRHQLIVGYVGSNLKKENLSIESRNHMSRLAVNWLQDQFDFAVEAANDPHAKPPSNSLMACLKHNPELNFIRTIPDDTRIAAEIRGDLSNLLSAIDQAKTTSMNSSAQ